jgi:hypothetical protein
MNFRFLAIALALMAIPVVGISLATSPNPVVIENFRSGNAAFQAAQLDIEVDSAFKIDDWSSKTGGVFPSKSNPLVTITANDGITFSWTSTQPVVAVIVKGGPGAQVYYYSGATSGSGLTAPINPRNGRPYGVSNVTFCFGKAPEEKICYEPITAFAFEPWYVGDEETGPYYEPYYLEHKGFERGGKCDPINLVTVDGEIAGRVLVSAPDGDGLVDITITLTNEDYRFADVKKNVKIETYKIFGYELTEEDINASTYQSKADPSKTTFTVTVPFECIYTIFVHLEREIPCP